MRGPTLSVVCGTHFPGPLVKANLQGVRSVADEIIIGADERVSEYDLNHYSQIADVLATFPFTGANEFRPWLRSLANGDWILFLDGDEFASEELVRRIPKLMENREVGAYSLSTRWVYPLCDTWIRQTPWFPHWNVRLVRNDDRLWFPARKHTGPFYSGPTKRVDASIVHLDLVLQGQHQRAAKVVEYDKESIGLFVNGRPINSEFYLPEERTGLSLEQLPYEDRRQARRSVEALHSNRAPRSRHKTNAIVRASKSDIRRTLPHEPMDVMDASASIKILEAPSTVNGGTHFLVRVEITNGGHRTWPAADQPGPMIRASYHWAMNGEVRFHDGLRSTLPHSLHTGESTDLDILVQSPLTPGEYELIPDVVAEGVCWFGSTKSVRITVEETIAELAQELSDAGKLDLSMLSDLRRRVGLQDALSWYLSPKIMAELKSREPEPCTPQVISSISASVETAVVGALLADGHPIIFCGDVKRLGALLHRLQNAASEKPQIVVLARDAVHESEIESLFNTFNAFEGKVVRTDTSVSLDPMERFTCVVGFSEKPLSLLLLKPLFWLRSQFREPQRLLVMDACSDLSLALMKSLVARSASTEFAVSLNRSFLGDGFLTPAGWGPKELL